VLVVGIVTGYIVRTSGAQSTVSTQPRNTVPNQLSQVSITPAATHALTWITVKTFAGTGNQLTRVFPIQHDWKIVWACGQKSFDGINASLKVAIYGPPDGTLINVGVNTICTKGSTGNSTEEHMVGKFFLVITCAGNWNLQIQEKH
jgi:hypothetical protein